MSFIHYISNLAKNNNCSHDLHSNDFLPLAVFYQIEIVYMILNIAYTYILHPTYTYVHTLIINL